MCWNDFRDSFLRAKSKDKEAVPAYFLLSDQLRGKAKWLQPGPGWPWSIPAGETSLTQTILKRIYFSLVVVPQCGLCSFLCWHKARSSSRRETNRWLDGKWDGSFQRQSWLMPAYSTHTALAWPGRGSCHLTEGFFACSNQSPTLLFWDGLRFRINIKAEKSLPSWWFFFFGCIKVFWGLGSMLELAADSPKSLWVLLSHGFPWCHHHHHHVGGCRTRAVFASRVLCAWQCLPRVFSQPWGSGTGSVHSFLVHKSCSTFCF